GVRAMSDGAFRPRWEALTGNGDLPLPEVEGPTGADRWAALVPTLTPCWRCGKEIPTDDPNCRYCKAGRHPEPVVLPVALAPTVAAEQEPLLPMLAFFGSLLLVTVLFHWIHSLDFGGHSRNEQLYLILIAEAVSTALVVIAWVSIRRRPWSPVSF